MKLENVSIEDLPAPVEKILNFDVDGLHFRMIITDNILIKVDEVFEMNVFKDYCKIICSVFINQRPFLRLQSQEILKDKVLDEWEKQKAKFVGMALEQNRIVNNGVIKKITI